MKLLPLKFTVFVSAFLLFEVELIVAKAILPGFGGSYLVWAACVLFFQVALLFGYGYSHLAARFLSPRVSGIIQAVIAFLPIVFFPLGLDDLAPEYELPFVAEVVWLLARGIGPAFLFLATVSVMSQNLLASSGRAERADPYFLYGSSNLGSLLGLVTYPFIIEPLFSLDDQLLVWQVAYGALALLQAPVIFSLLRGAPGAKTEEEAGADDGLPTNRRRLARWFLLSAAGSAMLLSVTNIISFELASVPLLWMAPLAIYLLTFYLVFKQRPFRPAIITDRFGLIVPVGIYLFMMSRLGYVIPPLIMLPAHLALLFVFSMRTQSDLIDSRPESTRGLTGFYLALAAGGVAGSALVSWIMPLISTSLLEYLAGFLIFYLAVVVDPEDEGGFSLRDLVGLVAVIPIAAWPLAKSMVGDGGASLVAGGAGVALAVIYFLIGARPRAVALCIAGALLVTPLLDYFQLDSSLVFKSRNYYGIYRVYDRDGKRMLRHGHTLHGRQYLDPERAKTPLLYYHPTAPAGELFGKGVFAKGDVALIGLGAGSLAAYAAPGQRFDFYELDPDNRYVAEEFFSYLRDSKGEIDYVFGDARLMLRRNEAARYGLIVIDAFNSDSIPVHLITVEAIAEYGERLTPGGALLFHLSNRYLNLVPTLAANAKELSLGCFYKTNLGAAHPDAAECEWMVLTDNAEMSRRLVHHLAWTDLAAEPPEKTASPWTDRYSNLLSAILAKD